MNHSLKISLGENTLGKDDGSSRSSGIVSIKKLSVRERLLKLLFGSKAKLTVIVPGESVEEMSISEIGKEATNETV